jgi:hypothetical protein
MIIMWLALLARRRRRIPSKVGRRGVFQSAQNWVSDREKTAGELFGPTHRAGDRPSDRRAATGPTRRRTHGTGRSLHDPVYEATATAARLQHPTREHHPEQLGGLPGSRCARGTSMQQWSARLDCARSRIREAARSRTRMARRTLETRSIMNRPVRDKLRSPIGAKNRRPRGPDRFRALARGNPHARHVRRRGLPATGALGS